MVLRRSLDDYKRQEHADEVFPGERRTQSGLFTGSDSRLVYVDPAGSIRDHSYALSGFYGIGSARFGIKRDDTIEWFEGGDASSQTAVTDSSLVETVHEFASFDVIQRDVTDGLAHLTSFEAVGEYPDSMAIVGFFEFVPEGQEGRVGQLRHAQQDVIEVYHNREHDYLGTSTQFSTVTPEVLEQFDEILSEQPHSFPRLESHDDYEGRRLTGGVSFRTELTDGTCTVVSMLSDLESRSRAASLAAMNDHTASYSDPAQITKSGRESFAHSTVDDPIIKTDLHVLELLTAPSGGRIAGPDFDPHYQYTGGYGYTWFRDDAEIATFLLEADDRLDLGIDQTHRQSATFYLETQLEDGRWPHRVWPMNGRIAPGWANGHIEGTENHYQADQTASALVFLANYLSTANDAIGTAMREAIRAALETGVEGLDLSIREDGLPVVCENAWENMVGRFTHTAAKFLHAYSAIANAPGEDDFQQRAAAQATRIYDALDTMWSPDDERFGLRLTDGKLDPRADCTTFSLVDAHLAYDAIRSVDDTRLERLDRHLDTTFDRLWKETDEIRGLRRFEDDTWRRRGQDSEKVWTVATGWGAYTAEKAMRLFDTTRQFDPQTWSTRLFAEIDRHGSLCLSAGYLPEQVFDTGTPDSATPLGWSHGIRLATHALRTTRDEHAIRTPDIHAGEN